MGLRVDSAWICGVAAILFCVTLASTARSQTLAPGFRHYDNFDRYQYLPRLPEGNENPPPLPKDTEPVKGSDKELVNELLGVIVLDNPDDAEESPESIAGVDVRAASTMMHSNGFRRIVSKYVGQPVSLLSLNKLSRDIVLFYRKHNQPVVDVSIPAGQDITDGVVQIVVTEGRIGKVCVEGPCYFDACMLRRQLRLRRGCPIYESVLLEEQRWLYRNPFRIVNMELKPGDNRGETDIIYKVRDKRPTRFYAGYEDTGVRSTGLERTVYGVNWFNAFGRDDQMGYQYTASSDFSAFNAHSMFYHTALQNRDIISVYGSFAEFDAPLPGFLFANQGSIGQVLTRWYREFCPIGNYEHGITAGLDYKNIDTELAFLGIPVFLAESEVMQLMAGYHGKRFDCRGAWLGGVDTFFSPGDWTSLNNTNAFQGIRPLSTADYWYSRGYLERRRYLSRRYELMLRASGQVADGNLVTTEQFGIGGYNSVRGYDINSALGDSGYFTNIELRTRPISTGLSNRYCDALGRLGDELTAHVFYDQGRAYLHSPLPGQQRDVDLHGVGVGARYNLQRRLTVRMDYGWALTNVNLPGQPTQPRHRIHLGVIGSY